MTERRFQVGDTFTLVRECDRYRPVYYAAVSGDFNPIHIDPEFGKLAGLGGAILHGLCTLGWAVDAFIRYLGDPSMVSRVKVRFSKPVAIEDVITFKGTVVAITNGVLTASVEATNQTGDLVLKGAELDARVSP